MEVRQVSSGVLPLGSLVLRVQLCDEDGGLEADGAHPRAILQVPQHDLPVLPRAEEVAVIYGPAQRLHLARVAAELARDAVCLDVEYDDDAIVLGAISRNHMQRHCFRVRVRMQANRRGD